MKPSQRQKISAAIVASVNRNNCEPLVNLLLDTSDEPEPTPICSDLPNSVSMETVAQALAQTFGLEQKIRCIKVLRSAFASLGLKEAKDLIERYM
jgi:hypothetical protein